MPNPDRREGERGPSKARNKHGRECRKFCQAGTSLEVMPPCGPGILANLPVLHVRSCRDSPLHTQASTIATPSMYRSSALLLKAPDVTPRELVVDKLCPVPDVALTALYSVIRPVASVNRRTAAVGNPWHSLRRCLHCHKVKTISLACLH